MSVVGYDDSPVSRLAHINLTTVSQNTDELTEHAVSAVIQRLNNGRTNHCEVVVHPRLVVRGTTRPPRSCWPPSSHELRGAAIAPMEIHPDDLPPRVRFAREASSDRRVSTPTVSPGSRGAEAPLLRPRMQR